MSKRNDPKGRNRKVAVWGDTPRRLRRMVVKGDCTMADVPALLRNTRHDTGTVTGRFNTVERSDGFHAAIEAPITPVHDQGSFHDQALRIKRSEAAKRAAATRKAKREAEEREIKDKAIENKRATRKATVPRHNK